MSKQFLKGVELNEGADQGYFVPNLTGNGPPTNKTEGAVGSQYMDTNNGDIYVCTAVENNDYTWINFGSNGSKDAVLYTPQNLTEEQKAQVRENIGAASATSVGDIETALNAIIAIQEELINNSTITFYITDSDIYVECTAVAGMTWGEWIESGMAPGELTWDGDMLWYENWNDDNGITLDDEIISGETYYFSAN